MGTVKSWVEEALSLTKEQEQLAKSKGTVELEDNLAMVRQALEQALLLIG